MSYEYSQNHSSYVLAVPGDKSSPHDYKYGVSVHTDNGQSLNGILWAPCLYGNNEPSPDAGTIQTSISSFHVALLIVGNFAKRIEYSKLGQIIDCNVYGSIQRLKFYRRILSVY